MKPISIAPLKAQERLAILIRHGQTPDNIDEGVSYVDGDGEQRTSKGLVISGHNDVRLTQEGQAQCLRGGVALATFLRGIGHDPSTPLRRWCSDLPRTRETQANFESAMEGFVLLDNDLEYVTWLRERDAGRYQGWLRREAIANDPGIERAFKDAHYWYPEGESLAVRGTLAGRHIGQALMETSAPVNVFFTHEITILGSLDYLEGGMDRDDVTAAAWQRKGQVNNAGFFVVRFNCWQKRGTVVYPA